MKFNDYLNKNRKPINEKVTMDEVINFGDFHITISIVNNIEDYTMSAHFSGIRTAIDALKKLASADVEDSTQEGVVGDPDQVIAAINKHTKAKFKFTS